MNKSYYNGGMKNDKLEGNGKFVWSDTRYYEGEWKNSSIHGFGILFDEGKIFMGI